MNGLLFHCCSGGYITQNRCFRLELFTAFIGLTKNFVCTVCLGSVQFFSMFYDNIFLNATKCGLHGRRYYTIISRIGL
jgi:hypothetical protein